MSENTQHFSQDRIDFKKWWDEVGSGIPPMSGDDMESHAHVVAHDAWIAARKAPQATLCELDMIAKLQEEVDTLKAKAKRLEDEIAATSIVVSRAESKAVASIAKERDDWKKHSAESDAELVAIWDALGLRKDPDGVSALDKIRDLIAQAGENGDKVDEAIRSVVSIRCTKHVKVPTINQNAHGGGECGACIEEAKDNAYEERNRCVALIARMAIALGLKACVTKTAIEGWSEDWHGCVYIDLPTGQVSWHFHDSQAHLFDGIPMEHVAWDGHTTDQKYDRVELAFSNDK